MTEYATSDELAALQHRVRVLELELSVARLEAENLELRTKVESLSSDQTWLYLVQDKSAGNRIFYVGITKQVEMRQRQHFSDPSSAVWQYIDANGGHDYSKNIEFIFLPAFSSRMYARIAEKMLIGCLPGLTNKDTDVMAKWCQTLNDGVVVPFRGRDDRHDRPGRPSTGQAQTDAERARRYRERKKAI